MFRHEADSRGNILHIMNGVVDANLKGGKIVSVNKELSYNDL